MISSLWISEVATGLGPWGPWGLISVAAPGLKVGRPMGDVLPRHIAGKWQARFAPNNSCNCGTRIDS
jgi:hypothetical protein